MTTFAPLRADVAGSERLDRLRRITGAQVDRLIGPTTDPSPPGVRLVDGGTLAGVVSVASRERRADYVCVLAALIRVLHSCDLLVGDALAVARWIEDAPPLPWLPLLGGRDDRTAPGGPSAIGLAEEMPRVPTGPRSGASRATDRAQLAHLAQLLLEGPGCPPPVASLLRRAALAPSAAPLPLEWVQVLRGTNRPDPVPWLHSGVPPTGLGPVTLTLFLSQDPGLAGAPGPWSMPPLRPDQRAVVLAGRHAQNLLVPLHGSGEAPPGPAKVCDEPLELGAELEANVRRHAVEAALLLAADGIGVSAVEIRVLGGYGVPAGELSALEVSLGETTGEWPLITPPR